jgi:hypothetical protein
LVEERRLRVDLDEAQEIEKKRQGNGNETAGESHMFETTAMGIKDWIMLAFRRA